MVVLYSWERIWEFQLLRLKNWEIWRHRNIFQKTAKEVLITQKDEEFVFQEPTLRRESTGRREKLSGESHGDREEFQPEERKDDARIQEDFWSVQGDFIYRHHFEPRVQLLVPREESFPMSSGQLIPTWTQHKKNELMTIGMSTETKICQIHGPDSQDLHYLTKLLREDFCGPGGD